MSRVSIPPMTPNNPNPRLNTQLDSLLSKLKKLNLLAEPRTRMYLLDSLISYWFDESPRELFEIMMKAEYKWRLALHAPYDLENDRMTASAVGYEEVSPPKGEDPPVDYDAGYAVGWHDGNTAFKNDLLGDDAKKAIQEIILTHRLRKSASGRLVCACNRGSDDILDWATHVRVRIMNYLKNEFVSLADKA